MKDILFDTQEKDIIFAKAETHNAIRQVVWGKLFGGDLDTYAYMNIIVPFTEIEEAFGQKSFDIYVEAEYYPSLLPVMVRICSLADDGVYEPKIERVAKGSLYNWLEKTEIKAAEMPIVDISGNFMIRFTDKDALVYSTSVDDIDVGEADNQSAELLALCQPGNLYRFPTTGIDGHQYINSIPEHTDLSEVLVSQYNADGKSVESAELESTTGTIVTEYNINEQDDLDMELTPPDQLDLSIINMTDDELVSLVLNGSSYNLIWKSDSYTTFTFNPNRQQVIRYEAVLNGMVAGEITYSIREGGEYATIDSKTGVIILSNSKAGGGITVVATFTPSDQQKYKTISIEKNITYDKATPTIKWDKAFAAIIVEGTSLSFLATSNSNADIVYLYDNTPSNGIVESVNAGEHVLVAKVAETELYKSAILKTNINVISQDSSDLAIYVGATSMYNTTPVNKEDVLNGMPIGNIGEFVLDCRESNWKTIWIAVPTGVDGFDGILYDPANDETQMFKKEIVGYTIWYWTQLMDMTQIYTTTKNNNICHN